jgi:hypothetical protein
MMEEMKMLLNAKDAPAEVGFSYRLLRMKLLDIIEATQFLDRACLDLHTSFVCLSNTLRKVLGWCGDRQVEANNNPRDG